MSNPFHLLKISRPRFWFYTFGPYLLGVTASATTRGELYDWRVLLFGIYFLFPANLLIYGINDIFDYETDRLNSKKQDYEALLDRSQHRSILKAGLVANLPFVASIFFIPAQATIAFSAFLFFAVFYSAPPVRAKAVPFLDSVFNILYIFPGAFGYLLLSDNWPSIKVLAAAALWTAAMHAYSAVPDIESDKQACLKTIATVLGPYLTVIMCAVLYLLSAVLAAEYLGLAAIPLASVYILMMLASLRSIMTGTLFRLYRAFPVINAIAGFLIFLRIAMSVPGT